MAKMIPDKPYYFDKRSHEDLVFYELEKLPDDYYVFHSFRIYKELNNSISEHETDFLIYNREKGIMVLEVKAGKPYCKDGIWYYQSHTKMEHGGPFKQVNSHRWFISQYIESLPKYSYLNEKCNICCAVWFLGYSDNELNNQTLPSEIDRKLILTNDSFKNVQESIEQIYSLPRYKKVVTDLSDQDHRNMIMKVLCPEFGIIATDNFEMKLQEVSFLQLLKEQELILKFLTEQRTVAINGAAGTGKTLIAVQKALMQADKNEKVLFLCFNSALRDSLEDKNKNVNIDYYDIAQYACKVCNTRQPDYEKLNNKLEEYFENDDFPYQDIVIDEGQDFGIDEIENSKVMLTLRSLIETKNNGCFYVFYDKLQLIQSRKIPSFINDLDCKITLYKNCRNTKNIAETSLRPIINRNAEMHPDAIEGEPTHIYYVKSDSEIINAVDKLIDKYKAKGIKNIVILTTKTFNKSALPAKLLNNGYYRNNYYFSTCRKFKGLEGEAIILIDVDENTFSDENKMIFYVGSSRAKFYLDIIANLNDNQCAKILIDDFNVQRKIRNGMKELAGKLNASPVKL